MQGLFLAQLRHHSRREDRNSILDRRRGGDDSRGDGDGGELRHGDVGERPLDEQRGLYCERHGLHYDQHCAHGRRHSDLASFSGIEAVECDDIVW